MLKLSSLQQHSFIVSHFQRVRNPGETLPSTTASGSLTSLRSRCQLTLWFHLKPRVPSAVGCSLPVVPCCMGFSTGQFRTCQLPFYKVCKQNSEWARSHRLFGSDVLVMEVIHYHFCYILFIRSKSSAPSMGVITQGYGYQEVGILGTIWGIANHNYLENVTWN